MCPRIIALYLPQYHPFPENDAWWGKGFTEWTNVGKAKPLFKGHEQPKVPADLGYYDLRIPESRELQVEYAKRAGVEGFCYYHYWFGGKELMERPFNEVVKLKSPDFPFCLCWANESWHNKFWNIDGNGGKKLLIEQTYIGEDDNKKHFYRLLNAFLDKRYLKQNNRLIFLIYSPLLFKNVSAFISQWNILAKENGLNGFYFVGHTTNKDNIQKILNLGFDAVNYNRIDSCYPCKGSLDFWKAEFLRKVFNRPVVIPYNKCINKLDGIEDSYEYVCPSIIPNWDHTPRSGVNGFLFHKSTPSLFSEHVSRVLNRIKHKQNKLVFLKSWNEWGEGNYMEPDLKWGCQYIDVLKEEISKYYE